MAAARRTPWGEAVAWALTEVFSADEQPDLEPEQEVGFGCLQPGLQPYFPEWRRVYVLEEPAFQDGLHIFKVEMDDYRAEESVWRRLAVPAHSSLEEPAVAILKAFKFNACDHLYEFRYRDQFGRGQVFNHPYTSEGPYSDEIEIGQLGLPDKGVIQFLFDFGDSWQFRLRLERRESPNSRVKRPKVIDSAGRPPQQYPDWD